MPSREGSICRWTTPASSSKDRSLFLGDPPTRVFCAYLATNLRNGKQYIGIIGTNGKTLAKRWREHCYEAGYNSHYLLHKAIRKYGEAAFRVEQIASARSLADILAVERHLITQYGTRSPNGYNLTSGGKAYSILLKKHARK